MARVFITGSSDGLGRMAAQFLIEQGHRVVLHARNERRGEEALAAVPGAVAGAGRAQPCGSSAHVNRRTGLARHQPAGRRFGQGHPCGLPEVVGKNRVRNVVRQAVARRREGTKTIFTSRPKAVAIRRSIESECPS